MANNKNITAIIDTREQEPLDLEKHGLITISKALTHGDYSLFIPDLAKYVTIERKSLPDFIACCGKERDRFEREILSLRGYRWKFVCCEFSMSDLYSHKYRSQLKPQAAMSSIARWLSEGIPFLMCDNKEIASYQVAKFLQLVAKNVIEFSNNVVGQS